MNSDNDNDKIYKLSINKFNYIIDNILNKQYNNNIPLYVSYKRYLGTILCDIIYYYNDDEIFIKLLGKYFYNSNDILLDIFKYISNYNIVNLVKTHVLNKYCEVITDSIIKSNFNILDIKHDYDMDNIVYNTSNIYYPDIIILFIYDFLYNISINEHKNNNFIESIKLLGIKYSDFKISVDEIINKYSINKNDLDKNNELEEEIVDKNSNVNKKIKSMDNLRNLFITKLENANIKIIKIINTIKNEDVNEYENVLLKKLIENVNLIINKSLEDLHTIKYINNENSFYTDILSQIKYIILEFRYIHKDILLNVFNELLLVLNYEDNDIFLLNTFLNLEFDKIIKKNIIK